MVSQLSLEGHACSEANIDALLTLSPNVRRWASDMTGQLMTLEPKEDLSHWVPLLKQLSDPYVTKYGQQSHQRVGHKLEMIFQQFRNATNVTELPEKLDMNYFKGLFQEGKASASALEAEGSEED